LGTGESVGCRFRGYLRLGLGGGYSLLGQRDGVGGYRPSRLRLCERGLDRLCALRPRSFGIGLRAVRLGVELLGLSARFVAFGVRRRDLGRGVRSHCGQLAFDPGGGELGMQRLCQRLHNPVEPVHYLEGLCHLAGESGHAPLPHPRVASRV